MHAKGELLMAVWIDIDNPPQAQYLSPLITYLETMGVKKNIVTVRGYGSTVDLVRNKGINPVVLGGEAGSSKISKIFVTVLRALRLIRYIKQNNNTPSYLISSSRSSALAAKLLDIPAFIFCDYEYAELNFYRRLGVTILHPEVIHANHFLSLGFKSSQLLPFPALKEDISFAYTDLNHTTPLKLPFENKAVKVLLRPPATRSHYYKNSSGKLYKDILGDLTRHKNIQIVLSPRYPEQATELLNSSLRHQPIILDNKANFVALLTSVDTVISSGGTMLREAAYLGVHAVSIFMGSKGAVDRHLAELGLLTFVGSIEDFRKVEFMPKSQNHVPKSPNPATIAHIIHEIEKLVSH